MRSRSSVGRRRDDGTSRRLGVLLSDATTARMSSVGLGSSAACPRRPGAASPRCRGCFRHPRDQRPRARRRTSLPQGTVFRRGPGPHPFLRLAPTLGWVASKARWFRHGHQGTRATTPQGHSKHMVSTHQAHGNPTASPQKAHSKPTTTTPPPSAGGTRGVYSPVLRSQNVGKATGRRSTEASRANARLEDVTHPAGPGRKGRSGGHRSDGPSPGGGFALHRSGVG